LSKPQRYLTLIASLSLIFCVITFLRGSRELRTVRRELLLVTEANELLKKTLGDMTVAITAKDREIDRLKNSGCDGQEKARPGNIIQRDRRRASQSDIVHRENAQQMPGSGVTRVLSSYKKRPNWPMF
jgi:hypothetical protein